MRDKPKADYHPLHVGEYGELEAAKDAVAEASQRVLLLNVLMAMDRYLNNAFMSDGTLTEDLFALRDAALDLADHLGFPARWYHPMTYDEAVAERDEARGKKKRVIPPDLRKRIFERDGNACQSCGAEEGLSVDHKIPESKGGTLDEENLWTLCRSCNSSKGTRTVEEWLTTNEGMSAA